MSLPTFSVIVPSYKYAAVLEGCVRSVLEQEGVDVRVLIVDDCSPDDTETVGRALAAHDDRVEFRRHEQNVGLIGTANEGIEWAHGEFSLLLSADDLLTPGALARAAEVMRRHPRVGLVYGHAPYWNDGEPLPSMTGRWTGTRLWAGADWARTVCRAAQNCISSPEAVVRTSVQRAVGGYDPVCDHASDLNMWLRIAAVSDVAYVRGAPQAIYRIHADSMFRSDYDPLRDLRERRKAFDSFFASGAAALPDAGELEALAGRALARQALWRASRAVDRDLIGSPDGFPLDEFVSFALDVHAEAKSLPEWRGLQLRLRIGAGRSGWFPPFLATGAAHRARGHVARARWARMGV
jgi:glycosyltransferase involved in cell wall biosynthesis